MDHLWAPWRLAYVAAAPKTSPDVDCFICRGLADADDRKNLIALRTSRTAVILNRYPYNNGHLLVAPLAHKAALSDLDADELLELQETLRRMIALLDQAISPHGYNVGLNIGRVAGAGLPGHLHWHIVPRWNGDTNFMSTVTDARVISQSLDALYDLLVSKMR
jgi:ATP adenylyltransferase